jgi:hypothetical protein
MATTYSSVVYTNAGQQYQAGTHAYSIQQPAPSFPPADVTATAVSGGNISGGVNGVNVTLYYAFTRVTLLRIGGAGPTYASQETSPSASAFAPFSISVALTAGTNYSVGISLSGGATFHGTNADGSTYSTNVYRLSTDQPQWYLVGNASADDFNDDISQAALSANVVLDLYHDPPPAGAGAIIFTHRDRLWFMVDELNQDNLFTQYATQLWYSDYGVPWSFNGANQVLLVGASDNEGVGVAPLTAGYDPTPGNCPMMGVSVSGVAILFKKYSAFILDGLDETTFFLSPLEGSFGCVAQKSVALCGQQIFWLSSRGVESWGLGQSVTYVGEPLRGVLSTYSADDLSAAVGWYSHQSYYLSFPTHGVTWVYRITDGKWWGPLPYATTYVSSQPAEVIPNGTTFNSIVAVNSSTVLEIDAWDAAWTDLGDSVVATWLSPISDSGRPWQRKAYMYVTIGAPVQPGIYATVQVSVWDVNIATPNTYTLTFNLGNAFYQTQSLPMTESRGVYAQVEIGLINSMSATATAQVWSVVVGGELLESYLQAS